MRYSLWPNSSPNVRTGGSYRCRGSLSSSTSGPGAVRLVFTCLHLAFLLGIKRMRSSSISIPTLPPSPPISASTTRREFERFSARARSRARCVRPGSAPDMPGEKSASNRGGSHDVDAETTDGDRVRTLTGSLESERDLFSLESEDSNECQSLRPSRRIEANSASTLSKPTLPTALS